MQHLLDAAAVPLLTPLLLLPAGKAPHDHLMSVYLAGGNLTAHRLLVQANCISPIDVLPIAVGGDFTLHDSLDLQYMYY